MQISRSTSSPSLAENVDSERQLFECPLSSLWYYTRTHTHTHTHTHTTQRTKLRKIKTQLSRGSNKQQRKYERFPGHIQTVPLTYEDNFISQLTPQQSIVAVYSLRVLIAPGEGGWKLPRVNTGFTLEGCSVTYWLVHLFPSAAILDFSVITASLGNLCHRPPPSNKQLPPRLGLLLLAAAGAEWQGHETGLGLWEVADRGASICADKWMHVCFSTPRKRRDTLFSKLQVCVCVCVWRGVLADLLHVQIWWKVCTITYFHSLFCQVRSLTLQVVVHLWWTAERSGSVSSIANKHCIPRHA